MIVFFVLHILTVLVNSEVPELEIPQGTLRGQYLESVSARKFSSFTAIPYAEPPIGVLRFKAPQPAGPWHGILDASKSHPICPQINVFVGDDTIRGDEDCLYLNVYTPQTTYPADKLLPVMIFLHGGGYLAGDGSRSSYDPSILMDKDIVLVIPNYRLGLLGFLSTGDEISPGNYGLKDQNLAIKWVKDNIKHFGGDPDSITLFGQSAGGSSAHFHMLSPLSKHLINRVICESGTAFSRWALAPNDQGTRYARKLARHFNCSVQTSFEMIECLRRVDAYELTKRQDLFYEWSFHPMMPFKPVIEPNIEGAFLSEHPMDTVKNGRAGNVTFMTGITTDEGAFVSPSLYNTPGLLEDFNEHFEKKAPLTMLYNEVAPDKNYVTKRIRKFYFGEKAIDNTTRSEVTNMLTDGNYLLAANEAVRLHLRYTHQPVYFYVFGYRGSVSFSSIFGDPLNDYGTCHVDELIYLFLLPNVFPQYELNHNERNMAEIMTTLWTNFAVTGDPTPTTDALIPEKWEPIKTDNLEFYFIMNDTNLEMSERYNWERAQFWDDLPLSTRKSFFNYYCKSKPWGKKYDGSVALHACNFYTELETLTPLSLEAA
ncbi:hypothetical protein ILUMI_04049 [Ignelater luminosus]|uniref:Carboxylic ester hydrolase n=1 Tax=Ignelater luminosus TaxID=2038154 RepID=A0A8K0DDJ9_IGNLU|nr:hypothetical protein ILUMI_04049 [Ignelater luminosus]